MEVILESKRSYFRGDVSWKGSNIRGFPLKGGSYFRGDIYRPEEAILEVYGSYFRGKMEVISIFNYYNASYQNISFDMQYYMEVILEE
jgi:hypothetical protein